mmetsp:Transcript_12236/g.30868  ORF Transcript_12236/g.30868 Transcript_12236/m.30868 type:complete len:259 (-) Transcript_12236:265-1041(-)
MLRPDFQQPVDVRPPRHHAHILLVLAHLACLESLLRYPGPRPRQTHPLALRAANPHIAGVHVVADEHEGHLADPEVLGAAEVVPRPRGRRHRAQPAAHEFEGDGAVGAVEEMEHGVVHAARILGLLREHDRGDHGRVRVVPEFLELFEDVRKVSFERYEVSGTGLALAWNDVHDLLELQEPVLVRGGEWQTIQRAFEISKWEPRDRELGHLARYKICEGGIRDEELVEVLAESEHCTVRNDHDGADGCGGPGEEESHA